ncbi:MAG TPA: peptide deformylase [Verrucomicrobiae bacterium]|nr:peptide deformylase [Verrucomicrobiae bacterium]
MILPILKYGHPMLRQKGARIERITPEVMKLIDDMLETMRAAAGIGLAAQQVGRALQLTVLDLRGVIDRPSTLERDGQPTDVDAAMPLVLINPHVTPAGPPVPGPEGCLSFPEIFEEIARPEAVEVTALNRDGQSFSFKAGGLLARAVQHEADHLNGILFIDRMASKDKQALKPTLDELQAATKAALSQKGGNAK